MLTTVRDARHRVVVDRLVAGASVDAGASESFGDPMLPEFVAEFLFSSSADVQLVAASLLAASPYRSGLAQVVVGELTTVGVATDQPDWADTLLGSLRLIGDVHQLDLVKRLAIAEGSPAQTAPAAAVRLGHVGGAAEPEYWRRVPGKYVTLWQRHGRQTDADQLDGLVYSAGILGQVTVLRALHADTTLPGQTRASATWWLNLPNHVLIGARQ